MQVPRTVPEDRGGLPGVRNAIAVASAKGGVGKSTVSTNLALSLAQTGVRVGLLDADIYGPSLPLLMGVQKQPDLTSEGKILPIEKHGVALMSIGFIAGEDAPVVWRGPLLAQALQHFISKVQWGDLDYLLIDLPPGTGDIPLTLSQTLALSGAVIVTTPQAVALEDVERGIAMFEKVEIPVLGVVENMMGLVDFIIHIILSTEARVDLDFRNADASYDAGVNITKTGKPCKNFDFAPKGS